MPAERGAMFSACKACEEYPRHSPAESERFRVRYADVSAGGSAGTSSGLQ